ncbi:helix-turn-helix transcriptional regulator [bacterium]|nr:helix-turn-helix transcriptional regulator [bacterium]
MCVVPWTPSPHALALAEQLILDADASASPLMRLRQAGRALEIFYEALAKREAPTLTEATGLRLRDHERMVRLRDFLDDEIRQPYLQALTIEALGQRFGLSASALQRQFRQAFSCSINEYRRNMRLLQARAELERGSTIAAAAERAGYGSAANFATAFRRQFGLSPRAVRGRV